jgi:hypothetical protein
MYSNSTIKREQLGLILSTLGGINTDLRKGRNSRLETKPQEECESNIFLRVRIQVADLGIRESTTQGEEEGEEKTNAVVFLVYPAVGSFSLTGV